MKKILLTLFLIIALLPIKAFATVGGPNYFTDFYYKTTTNEIFIFKDEPDGRGCTNLLKLSINTNKLTTEASCIGEIDEDSIKKIQDKKKSIEANSIKLKEVDLNRLKISFKSKLTSGNFFEKDGKVKKDLGIFMDDSDFWFLDYFINWKITPTLDSKEKNSFNVKTCIKKPAMNFTGLASPNHKFLVIVSTAISQCFEYGYPDDTASVIKDVSIPSGAFLDKYKPGYIWNEKSWLNEIKAMKGKHHIKGDLTSVLYYLNNTGFQAYKEGSYESAMYFFKNSYNDAYLMPLFNLAATQAKTGETEDSFKSLDKLLSYKSTKKFYLGKIAKDSDFDKMRKDKRYLKYFENYTPPKKDIPKSNTKTKGQSQNELGKTSGEKDEPIVESIDETKKTKSDNKEVIGTTDDTKKTSDDKKDTKSNNMFYYIVIGVILLVLLASKGKRRKD